MKRLNIGLFCVTALLLTVNVFSQEMNTFDGYSFDIGANKTTACAIRFLPHDGVKNTIQVFEAGTDQKTPAVGLTACNQSRVQGNQIFPSGADQKWCFQGPEDLYEIKFTNGDTYLWPAAGKDSGFYNVKDFRPVKRTGSTGAKYTRTEPADYTHTIRNALAVMASRQGGTLQFPDGDYVVGTTDGNTRDPRYEAITLPSGVTITGTGAGYSIPNTNLPNRKGSSRIRLRNDNQAIFRIGNCTNNISVKNIELVANIALYGESGRSSVGTYGIEGLGIWAIDQTTGAQQRNQSMYFRFENITFQEFDKGIFVRNINDTKCDPRQQICNGWQFDLIKVDQCFFFNNKTGIYVDSLNTDWGVSNSYFTAMEANAPGDSIHIKRATSFLIEQTFGGGYNETDQQGGTFINIGTVASLTVLNSGSERGRRSIYTDPNGAISSMMMTIVGSVFSDPIELTGRINFVSTGNLYFAKTIQATPKVNITSTGDRFCWDPLITTGVCKDDAGRTINRPRFGDGHVMFQTGRVPEGNGADVLERQPNTFGYDVEITDDKATSSEPLLFSRTSNPNRPVLRLGSQSQYYDFRRSANSGFLSITGNQEKPFAGIAINGPLQFDPNITFSDITKYASASLVPGQPVVTDGALVYCKDCRKDQSGVCTQGKVGTDGAFAKRINNKWRCD